MMVMMSLSAFSSLLSLQDNDEKRGKAMSRWRKSRSRGETRERQKDKVTDDYDEFLLPSRLLPLPGTMKVATGRET